MLLRYNQRRSQRFSAFHEGSPENDLCWATRTGNMNQIKRLLTENGKNFINCHNKKGYTPVHYSVMDDDFIMCKFLIDSGADVNRPSKCLACKLQPLYYAVIRGNAEICQMLLSHGAINGRVDAMGNCYLHYAAYYAHPGVCEVLLDPKASWSTSPDLYNDHGETPLYWSVKYGRVSVCKLLLSRSADWEIATAYGSTVLDVAEHPEIIDLISKRRSARDRTRMLYLVQATGLPLSKYDYNNNINNRSHKNNCEGLRSPLISCLCADLVRATMEFL